MHTPRWGGFLERSISRSGARGKMCSHFCLGYPKRRPVRVIEVRNLVRNFSGSQPSSQPNSLGWGMSNQPTTFFWWLVQPTTVFFVVGSTYVEPTNYIFLVVGSTYVEPTTFFFEVGSVNFQVGW